MLPTHRLDAFRVVARHGDGWMFAPTLDSSHAGDVPEGATLVFGDPQDIQSGEANPLGHGVLLREHAGTLTVHASLTGFPPIFLRECLGRTIVASSVADLVDVSLEGLQFDCQGLAEWASIGRPINGRTLFEGVRLVPAGAMLRFAPDGSVRQSVDGLTPSPTPFSSYEDYMEAQGTAMRAAVRRMRGDRSAVLSLTAGLDTRAVLSLLIDEGVTFTAVTLSGERDSIDALVAAELSRAYGVAHQVVRPDTAFRHRLTEFAETAVRLSGGLCGFDQAFEVHMYSVLGAAGLARFSGNLGNQVGRSGTEGAGRRGMASEWFAAPVRSSFEELPREHWFRQIASDGAHLNAQDLIERESLYASLGNASIGSALALQRSPYTDRLVLHQKLREPVGGRVESSGGLGVRIRDLRHRVLGTPMTQSFQRRVVVGCGGAAASIPVNWGWRPTGGVAAHGCLRGLGALLDMLSERSAVARSSVARVGLAGLSGFHRELEVAQHAGWEFVRSELRDALERVPGIFDRPAVERLIAVTSPSAPSASTGLQLATIAMASRVFGVRG
jgi:hypothetical protein